MKVWIYQLLFSPYYTQTRSYVPLVHFESFGPGIDFFQIYLLQKTQVEIKIGQTIWAKILPKIEMLRMRMRITDRD